jgi:hypothetical protein
MLEVGVILVVVGFVSSAWCCPVVGNDFKAFVCGWVSLIGVALIVLSFIF